MTTRFIANPLGQVSGGPGKVYDFPDIAAASLAANDYILVGGVGATSGRAAWIAGPAAAWAATGGSRPSNYSGAPNVTDNVPGTPVPAGDALWYFDTTLNKLVYTVDSGTTWRDPASGSAV